MFRVVVLETDEKLQEEDDYNAPFKMPDADMQFRQKILVAT